MKAKTFTNGLMIFILALALIVPATALSKDLPKNVFIATNAQGSIYYSLGGVVAKIIDKYAGIGARVKPFSGSSAYIPAISLGKVDLGVNNTNDIRLAYRGKKPFIPSPNIRVLTAMNPLLVGLLVRNNSDIKTVMDMKGKRVAAKFPAQLSIVYCIGGMMAADNLSWSDVVEIPVTNIVVGIQALKDKRLDVTAFAVMAAKVKEANATISGGIRFLNINGSPEGAAKMAEIFPGSYPFTIKANAPGTAGILQDTTVQAYDVFLTSGTHLSIDAAYEITKALYENVDEVRKGHKMLGLFGGDRMVKLNATVPYHEGAVKFYQEIGLWSKEMDKVQTKLLSKS